MRIVTQSMVARWSALAVLVPAQKSPPPALTAVAALTNNQVTLA